MSPLMGLAKSNVRGSSENRVVTAKSNGSQRVTQRVKCLIINGCNAATALWREGEE